MLITPEHIAEFKKDGITVIENVLSEDEILMARHGLHKQLKSLGLDHDKILSGEQVAPIDARIKSPVSRFFYAKWKLLDVALNAKVAEAYRVLMSETFASGDIPGFEHPMGRSTDILAMVDRICWRLPDHIRAEGGLGLHLDRNPIDPFLNNSNGRLSKWRPIQSFVTLTDHYGGESGGLRVVKGFHLKIDEYFQKDSTILEKIGNNGGEFYRMNSKSYNALLKQCHSVDIPAGSLVCWDNRLPHATCDKLLSTDSREVIYLSYLPDIPLNQEYIKKQLSAIISNRPPPAYFDESNLSEISDRDWEDSELTNTQKTLLGFNLHYSRFHQQN